MPLTNFRSPYPCRPHAVFGFDHDWVNKSVIFYSFHWRNTKIEEHNLLVNQAILIDHGASDAFDHIQYD